MKILHLWNTGGGPSVMARYSEYESHVLMAGYMDPYDICACYTDVCTVVNYPVLKSRCFGLRALAESRRYDIVHIHAGPKLFYWFHKFSRIFQKKKLIFHYHGSDIRLTPKDIRLDVEKYADRILVSTPDLLQYKLDVELTYVPNPVDTKLFARHDDISCNNRGRCNLKPGQDNDWTKNVLDEYGYGDVDWDFQCRLGGAAERNSGGRVAFADMPHILLDYEYYADIHFDKSTGRTYQADSKTALEAMSLGLKVIRYDGTTSNKLPKRHMPENVAKQMDSIYRDIA
ncbi:MAG: glycosyltransferase family 4 protein [Thaumarchaeota archaeon]|nr:glycosyltransferase family 4 protein [Nitrososphaerota archaeon]